jgi:hypothetical protein
MFMRTGQAAASIEPNVQHGHITLLTVLKHSRWCCGRNLDSTLWPDWDYTGKLQGSPYMSMLEEEEIQVLRAGRLADIGGFEVGGMVLILRKVT